MNSVTQRPIVSVIVPMYNVESYISECIESIVVQTYDSLDIILVDDGSPDLSWKIAQDFGNRDARVRLIRQNNAGVSVARNVGLDAAIGDFVCFVDGDDWIAPTFVAQMLSLAMIGSTDLVIGTKVLGDSQNSPPIPSLGPATWSSDYAISEFLYGNIVIGCWNKMYRRSTIDDIGLRFSEDLFMGEGLNFVVAFAQQIAGITATNNAAYYYRKSNTSSATSTISVKKMDNALNAISNIRRDLVTATPSTLNALNYHESMVGFAALRAISSEKIRSGLPRRDNWDSSVDLRAVSALKRLTPRVIARSRVPAAQKFKAVLMLMAPRSAAKISVAARQRVLPTSRFWIER